MTVNDLKLESCIPFIWSHVSKIFDAKRLMKRVIESL